jgi:hypothetical protein
VDLKREHLAEALDRITAWRADPGTVQSCPACGAPGIEIVDRSARPYSEWYALRCTGCGLDTALHIPLPGPVAY